MDYEKELTHYEQRAEKYSQVDIRLIVELAEKLREGESNDANLYIRMIYLLHNILVEEEYPMSKYENLVELLRELFDSSYRRFSDLPEYLFFIGKILYVSEWFFGLDDDLKDMEERLAYKMQRKAHLLEPDNALYEWAYVFSKDEKRRAYELSSQILNDRAQSIKWLEQKGFPGQYVIESIKYCHDTYEGLSSSPPA